MDDERKIDKIIEHGGRMTDEKNKIRLTVRLNDNLWVRLNENRGDENRAALVRRLIKGKAYNPEAPGKMFRPERYDPEAPRLVSMDLSPWEKRLLELKCASGETPHDAARRMIREYCEDVEHARNTIQRLAPVLERHSIAPVGWPALHPQHASFPPKAETKQQKKRSTTKHDQKRSSRIHGRS